MEQQEFYGVNNISHTIVVFIVSLAGFLMYG